MENDVINDDTNLKVIFDYVLSHRHLFKQNILWNKREL